MGEISRRNLLMFACSLPLGFYPGSSVAVLTGNDLTGAIKMELQVILSSWLAKEKALPEDFIRGRKYSEGSALHEIIKEEFSMGDTLDVNGLVLSKTEAAFLAQLAVIYT